MDEMKARIVVLDEENSTLEDEAKCLSVGEKEYQRTVENFNDKVKVKAMEVEKSSLSRELKDLRSAVERQQDTFTDLEGKVNETNQRESITEDLKVVDVLKKENEDLQAEKERLASLEEKLAQRSSNQIQNIKILEKRFQETKSLAEEREKRLREEIARQKTSLNSLFEDLSASRELAERLQTENDSLRAEKFELPRGRQRRAMLMDNLHLIDSNKNIMRKESMRKLDTGLAPQGRRVSFMNDSSEQADLLQGVVAKKNKDNARGLFGMFSRSTTTSNASDADDRVQKLEEEIAELRSSLVKLQTEYKEETYKHRKTIQELQNENEAILLKNAALVDKMCCR
jgi:predicted  nucleic acid-binding Zn-ribbon protein